MPVAAAPGQKYPPSVLQAEGLWALFDALLADGWRLAGPRVRDGAIVYDDLTSPADLPRGITDEQAPGRYRLAPRQDQAFFGYVVGPHSWKKYLFPTFAKLWTATTTADRIDVKAQPTEAPRTAFIGVRACELAAIAIQDRVFLEGAFVDPVYQARRENVMTVAVNCGQAGDTCFCDSMNTGPKAKSGYDIALTEILDGPQRFLAEAATERGAAILEKLTSHPATEADRTAADAAVARAVSQMGRSLDTDGLPALLQRNAEHRRWDQVATRCLACANCTMVCPTCFCSSAEDVADLALEHADRVRRWDSCFSGEFSYIHGGNIRASIKSRYRQWMTHKLSTWHDQFGTSGCVGCGRCITWCPTGIDITEEAREIRNSEKKS